jgi:Protein of unknown function (DUF1638).
MKSKIIACEVMKEEILSMGSIKDVEFEFVSMDFHLYPKKLKVELQNIIDRSNGYNRIILAFGLCGGASNGLKANDSTLIIPKVHDCISVFLYDSTKCVCDFKKEKGTFYLSSGWMITEKSILSDHKKILEKYGEKKAFSILKRMYEDYKKVLFIKTGSSSENEVIAQSKEIANLFDAKYEIIKGKTDFIEKILKGPWDDKNFINIAPGELLTEEHFW